MASTHRERDKRLHDELHALGCRIHGISIGRKHNPYFDALCDWWAPVEDLTDPKDVTDQLVGPLRPLRASVAPRRRRSGLHRVPSRSSHAAA
jgi:hypothetical protein